MKIKTCNSAQRFTIVNGFDAITVSILKKSSEILKKTGGRNNSGKMTVPHRGGGHKRRYREIDFKRNKFEIEGQIVSIQYDPNRTAFIALVKYTDGEKRYIIAQNGLKVGQKIISGQNVPPDIGNAMPLSSIPLGTIISCIELKPKKGASIARSAGTF